MQRTFMQKRLLAAFLSIILFMGSLSSMSVKAAEQDAVVTQEKEKEELREEKLQREERQSEKEEPRYYQWESIQEILKLCEEGLDLQEFFKYTIWDSLSVQELREIAEAGITLEEWYETIPAVLSLGDTKVAGFSGSMSSALGNIPALGSGSHGSILKIHLSGTTAFCAQFGAACRTGMIYTAVPLSQIGIDSGKERTIRGLLAQYQQAQSVYTGPVNYIMTQAGIWLVQNNGWSGDAEAMAASVAPLFTKTPDCPSVEFARDYFQAVVEWLDLPENQTLIENMGLEAWANGPNQYLITASAGQGGTVAQSDYAHVELRKVDAETGEVIVPEASFTIYEWNGTSFEKSNLRMYREGTVYRSDDLFRTERNKGRFQIEESRAPAKGTVTGYYGDFQNGGKRRYEVEVKKGMQGEGIPITNAGERYVNERATGSIRVLKKDIEAGAYVTGEHSHGTAVLDGAVYDLYAREDILHPDGVTGVLFEKDTKVASGTIREGSCLFEKLYLGSYYVKERQKGDTLTDGKKLSYAEGYLLDETIYEVVLSYEGENVKNVHREVESDKEQVVKAKAVLEKVESATGQGNISHLEGAGFTLYRIDKLSKLSSFEKNPDGTYVEESIRKAYRRESYNQNQPKYDFSGEEGAIATVYLRDTNERKDTAGYWADGQKDIKAGKLISLGNHYYRVAELFSDENGLVVTPYLPYGQYLVVETTVPEDHFMAPPFVLTFQQGRSGQVLTTGVTQETPFGNNFLKSQGEETDSWEAVYFSQVIDNEATEQLLRLYKKDQDTGKTVLLANSGFKIARLDEQGGKKTYLTHTVYYPETVNREVFFTNAQGYLQLPELLSVGLYQIEEVEGPNGFFNAGEKGYVQFRVTTDREYEAVGSGADGSTLEGDFGKRDILLITEQYANSETRGRLLLRKMGETLTDYRASGLLGRLGSILGLESFLGLKSQKEFVYEEHPLSGAEYTIRAAEDIYTQDRQTDKAGKRTLWFSKGETVAVVCTGEEGQQDTLRVKTKKYPNGHPMVQVVHDGTLGSVELELPLGRYEIEETKAPYGYTRIEDICTVCFTWEHQFQEFVFNNRILEEEGNISTDVSDGSVTFTNQRVKAVPKEESQAPGIGIVKKARENGQPLAGVTFGLYSVDGIYDGAGRELVSAGSLLSTCETDDEGWGIFAQDVPIRDEAYKAGSRKNSGRYEIRELSTPSGILLDTEPIFLEFLYQDEGTEFVVIRGEKENKTSEVFISKQDLANSQELSGAKLTVKEEWSGEIAQSWISGEKSYELRALAVNSSLENPPYTYLLTEVLAPENYELAESIRFCLLEEEAVDGSLKNSVYVWDKNAGMWMKAEKNQVVMKDARKGSEERPSGKTEQKKPIKPQEVKTGDFSQLFLYAVLAGLSAVLMSGFFQFWKRKWKKEKGRS